MAEKEDGLERNPGYLVHDVARLLRREFDRRVKHMGLTRAQWFVLAHLYRNDGRTQRALADELDMEPAPLGKLIDRLEESDWVRRAPDPKDRRAKLVFLTDQILPLIEAMRSNSQSLYADAFSGASQKKIDAFIDVLATAKTNLTDLAGDNIKTAGDLAIAPLKRSRRREAKRRALK